MNTGPAASIRWRVSAICWIVGSHKHLYTKVFVVDKHNMEPYAL